MFKSKTVYVLVHTGRFGYAPKSLTLIQQQTVNHICVICRRKWYSKVKNIPPKSI